MYVIVLNTLRTISRDKLTKIKFSLNLTNLVVAVVIVVILCSVIDLPCLQISSSFPFLGLRKEVGSGNLGLKTRLIAHYIRVDMILETPRLR